MKWKGQAKWPPSWKQTSILWKLKSIFCIAITSLKLWKFHWTKWSIFWGQCTCFIKNQVFSCFSFPAHSESYKSFFLPFQPKAIPSPAHIEQHPSPESTESEIIIRDDSMKPSSSLVKPQSVQSNYAMCLYIRIHLHVPVSVCLCSHKDRQWQVVKRIIRVRVNRAGWVPRCSEITQSCLDICLWSA